MNDDATVSVVDDDPVVLRSLCALLGGRGYSVTPFASAEQFLAAADNDRPGCVVTDLKMPGKDGGQLVAELAASGSPLSVIVVTGHADVPTAVELMSQGAVTVLEKPYETRAIVGAVEEALARSRARLAAAASERELQEKLDQLTEEECAVMHGMVAGTPIKALARHLGISMRTVDRRRTAVLQKMEVNSIGELGGLLARRPPEDRHTA